MRSLGDVLAFTFFVVLGLGVAAVSLAHPALPPRVAAVGLTIATVAGGCGASLAYIRYDMRRRSEVSILRTAVLHGTLRHADRHTPQPAGLVFRGRRLRQLPLGFLATVGLLAGLGFCAGVLSSSGRWTGQWWLKTVIYGGVGLVLVVGCVFLLALTVGHLVGPRTGVALLPDGVFLRTALGTIWLPWDAIHDTQSLLNRDKADTVLLHTSTPDALQQTGLYRIPRLWGRGRSRSTVSVPCGLLGLPTGPLVIELDRYRQHPAHRRELADPDTVAAYRGAVGRDPSGPQQR
ncbi:hypothetical protein RIF23_05815 [Lipingzhangella sp. LS1_29]|uniref:PH (Pleckstrin Homology) domain-containing protein n=1 Tax=Lipingzhangella rawalii TaxID=2055835 RepID=A0ABU2H5B2_9ACTN|nr:hypothetical protein [Lipingzhangella rawalii]MDS1269809.1 hypothetical protein [Lipingzhangella rawalii]